MRVVMWRYRLVRLLWNEDVVQPLDEIGEMQMGDAKICTSDSL